MKSGELISMIKAADPSGNGLIMDSDGGIPYYFEEKPGYYDGAYRYIDKRGRLTFSIQEHKVDIGSKVISDMIWTNLEAEIGRKKRESVLNGTIYVVDEQEYMKIAKDQIVFHEGVPEEFKKNVMMTLEREFNDWMQFKVQNDEKWIEKTMNECRKGLRFYQTKEAQKDGWKLWSTNTKEHEGVCFGMIDAITESGMFKREEYDEKWWEWKLKS